MNHDSTTDRARRTPVPRIASIAPIIVLAGIVLLGCEARETRPVQYTMPSIVEPPPAGDPVPADEGQPGTWERAGTLEPAGRLFVVVPEGEVSGGILLVHGSWGVNEDVRALAREIAARGLAVVVPDVYDGLVLTTRLAERDALAGVDGERSLALLRAGADRLHQVPGLEQARLGVLALASGAAWAMRFSENSDDVGAVVVDSALLVEDAAPSHAVPFETMLLVGELNRSIGGARIDEARSAFEATGSSLIVASIPGAGTDLLDPRAFGHSGTARPVALERALAFLGERIGVRKGDS